MSARFSALFLILFAANANAASCDFTNLKFGITQEKLKKEYKLDTMDVATTGEGIIQIGSEICEGLPVKSQLKFSLLDNNFVQLTITNQNTGELLTFAQKIFGDQDNTKKQKKIKTAMWNKKHKYNVMYNTYTLGRHDQERIIITSVKHQKLFDKQNEADDKASDEDQKASKSENKKSNKSKN
jgi:hypothetical protein